MTEEFLQFLWQYRLYNELYTCDNHEPVIALEPGRLNTDSGPDFFNSRVRIGNTLWAGNVEVHIQSSDWIRHHHQEDVAYDNVILHVVDTNDMIIRRRNGLAIPTVELQGRFDPLLLDKYQFLARNKAWIPCHNLLYQAENIVVNSWLESLFIMRIENKVKEVRSLLERFGNDWDKTLLVLVARCFGLKSNILPFEMLASSFPYTILSKIRSDISMTEALLFGQAGMLSEPRDDYQADLSKKYSFLRTKFQMDPIEQGIWKFMRLRPRQFPTLRIAQMSALLHKTDRFFSEIAESESIEQLSSLFGAITSEYWVTHFKFGKESPPSIKIISDDLRLLIFVNAVIPSLFAFGKIRNEQSYINKAIDFAYSLPPERNSVLDKFLHSGIKANNAAQSQALLELKKSFCETKQCLKCRIGYRIMRNTHQVL